MNEIAKAVPIPLVSREKGVDWGLAAACFVGLSPAKRVERVQFTWHVFTVAFNTRYVFAASCSSM